MKGVRFAAETEAETRMARGSVRDEAAQTCVNMNLHPACGSDETITMHARGVGSCLDQHVLQKARALENTCPKTRALKHVP